MIPTKEMTSFVPVDPKEIVDDVLACCEVGLTMVHIHTRDNKGDPNWRPEIFEEIIVNIRKYQPELIICVTCSGRTYQEFEKRSAVLDLEGKAKPDMASLTLSSVNFNKVASINEPKMIIALAEKMKEKRIKPELEAFDLGMINYAKYLIKRNLLDPPYYFNLLFGNIACAQANLLSIGLMEKELPNESICSFAGIGDTQLMVNSLAVVVGAGVRIGLEDNIWFDSQRTVLASNKQLLERIKRIAADCERRIMKPADARKILKLQKPEYGYGLI
jgi:uncharacterized protein (DUF849 family)